MKFEEDTNKWKHILCSCIGRLNVIKMSIPSTEIYAFNIILIKIQMTHFTELEKIIQKMYMETQKTLKNDSNLEKEKQSQRNHT